MIMTLLSRFLTLLALGSCFTLMAGCDYFGTHEGYEDGESPLWGVEGMATFEVVGISPTTANVGEEVTVYTVSEESAPTSSFVIEDFWFCTFDGESAMIETGGNEYDPEADIDEAMDNPDVELTDTDLEGNTVSTVTFTVPEGTVTGEGLVFTPSDTQYFVLGIE
ncbi:MAG: hypothetical protein CL928_15165 [Deltaproteobacteria bacterium]|nr:hypothetical protein [Deltaproteobacteria bacterium]